jgi:DHA2 family multidrug resistance protein
MAFVGRIANKVDARPMIVFGALLFLGSMTLMSRLTLDSGQDELFWPLILRGVGLGFLFVPLTSATVAGLPMRLIGQGTGMFNLMRQLGGSLGIATMATMLARQTVVQKQLLTEHVGSYDPTTMARLGGLTKALVARGIDASIAKQQALMIMDRQIATQASVIAFSRIYLLSGVLLVAALPLLLIWKTGKAASIKVDLH